MQLIPSDPNIETIVSRISKGEINLQPGFQRGEVWSYQKQQRLIDTILRKWHIPPIHLVEVEADGSKEVLDGQQRLVSVREFVRGHVKINGKQQPLDPFIESLDGLTYGGLPQKVKRAFDDYSIRIFSLVDYKPDEPGELFFRLNQPTSLTAAEQRNAFYGPVRNQIKDLVKFSLSHDIGPDFLGFSNSRMAYDDVFSRLALTFETRSLWEKITSARITEYYRSNMPLKKETIDELEGSLLLLSSMKKWLGDPIRFNRATLYTWLCFFIRLRLPFQNPNHKKVVVLAQFVQVFEQLRARVKQGGAADLAIIWRSEMRIDPDLLFRMATIYNDRASSRIYDVSSTLLRDIITWLAFAIYIKGVPSSEFDSDNHLNLIRSVLSKIKDPRGLESALEKFAEETKWGRQI